MTDSVAGSFLVATPLIGAPPFARAVILMLEHDDSGAVGIVLNAKTQLLVTEHLPMLTDRVSPPASVFLGGPVATDTAVTLGVSGTADFLRPTPLGNIGIVDPEGLPDDLSGLRVFAGYSGWDPGQLETELREGSWWVLPADRSAIFAADTSDLWQRTIKSAPGTIAFHTTFPEDVSLN